MIGKIAIVVFALAAAAQAAIFDKELWTTYVDNVLVKSAMFRGQSVEDAYIMAPARTCMFKFNHLRELHYTIDSPLDLIVLDACKDTREADPMSFTKYDNDASLQEIFAADFNAVAAGPKEKTIKYISEMMAAEIEGSTCTRGKDLSLDFLIAACPEGLHECIPFDLPQKEVFLYQAISGAHGIQLRCQMTNLKPEVKTIKMPTA